MQILWKSFPQESELSLYNIFLKHAQVLVILAFNFENTNTQTKKKYVSRIFIKVQCLYSGTTFKTYKI